MSHVIVRPAVAAQQITRYERMVKTLRAAFENDDNELAAFLVRREASDPSRQKRDLARELIRYVLDQRYLVKPHA